MAIRPLSFFYLLSAHVYDLPPNGPYHTAPSHTGRPAGSGESGGDKLRAKTRHSLPKPETTQYPHYEGFVQLSSHKDASKDNKSKRGMVCESTRMLLVIHVFEREYPATALEIESLE